MTRTFNHAPGLGGRWQMLAYNILERRGNEYSIPGINAQAAISYAKEQARLDGRDYVIVRDPMGTVHYEGTSNEY